jgi:hypothetical protein
LFCVAKDSSSSALDVVTTDASLAESAGGVTATDGWRRSALALIWGSVVVPNGDPIEAMTTAKAKAKNPPITQPCRRSRRIPACQPNKRVPRRVAIAFLAKGFLIMGFVGSVGSFMAKNSLT